MLDLPIYNDVLEVEAVGFEQRAGRLSGVLITPWCMNLVLWPKDSDEWQDLASKKTIAVDFPSGSYHCMLSVIDGIAPYISLPLFSTVQDFADQDTARSVALEVLRRLYDSTGHKHNDDIANDAGAAKAPKRTMTRRDLLRGWGVMQ